MVSIYDRVAIVLSRDGIYMKGISKRFIVDRVMESGNYDYSAVEAVVNKMIAGGRAKGTIVKARNNRLNCRYIGKRITSRKSSYGTNKQQKRSPNRQLKLSKVLKQPIPVAQREEKEEEYDEKEEVYEDEEEQYEDEDEEYEEMEEEDDEMEQEDEESEETTPFDPKYHCCIGCHDTHKRLERRDVIEVGSTLYAQWDNIKSMARFIEVNVLFT